MLLKQRNNEKELKKLELEIDKELEFLPKDHREYLRNERKANATTAMSVTARTPELENPFQILGQNGFRMK